MRWVTWKGIGVDRMACIWLVKRYIDPSAAFMFIDYGAKPGPDDGTPFDLPGARLSHRANHCTFHTMLAEHDLTDPVLRRIARIVDEADVVQDVSVEPAAPGLDLICRGLRRLAGDDAAAIESALLIYDALYAELAAEAM